MHAKILEDHSKTNPILSKIQPKNGQLIMSWFLERYNFMNIP